MHLRIRTAWAQPCSGGLGATLFMRLGRNLVQAAWAQPCLGGLGATLFMRLGRNLV